jgi:hypothetical protein
MNTQLRSDESKIAVSKRDKSDNPDSNNKDVVDMVVEGMEGTDRPMEESHPYAPAMLAFGAYPIALCIVIIVAVVIWFSYR